MEKRLSQVAETGDYLENSLWQNAFYSRIQRRNCFRISPVWLDTQSLCTEHDGPGAPEWSPILLGLTSGIFNRATIPQTRHILSPQPSLSKRYLDGIQMCKRGPWKNNTQDRCLSRRNYVWQTEIGRERHLMSFVLKCLRGNYVLFDLYCFWFLVVTL